MIQKFNSFLTKFDHYLITSCNNKIKGKYRNMYKCTINPKEECDFLTYSRTNTELQRFFGHLIQRHPDELLNFLIHYVTNHSFTDITKISCIDQMIIY